MKFSETACKDFKNIRTGRYAWGAELNVILGPNGSGKTNFLESLNVLSGWGTFIGGKISSMISWNALSPRALLHAEVCGEQSFEVSAILSSRITMKAAGDRISYSDLRARLPSLSFLPSDISLIDGSPSVRRFFLDKLCALWSPAYARRLSEYKQLLRHRCALLRQGRPIKITTAPMVNLGGWIQECRIRFIRLLNETLSSGGALFPAAADLSIYPAVPEGLSAQASLEAYLAATEEREKHACRPLAGPHRDDLAIICNGRPAASALSRGQKRRLVISMILSAAKVIEVKLRLKPVLIFDDLGAELDSDAKKAAGKALYETGCQIFISGVENPFPELERESKIMTLPN